MAGFTLNVKNKFEIDTSGSIDPTDATSASWAQIAAGIEQVTPNPNDTTDNTAYYDGDGFASTDVTGKNYSLDFSGNRKEGDAAQDYIASKELLTGEDVKTLLRWTKTDGTEIIAQVTLSSIVTSGGNANAKQTFSFTANFNGAPVINTSGTTTTTTAG